MDVDLEVKRCAEMMARDPQAELDDFVQRLVSGGLTEIEAEALIAFVPIGFAHAVLSEAGVQLPNSFLVRDPDTGELIRASLADDSVFQSANRLARNMLAVESSRHDALRIVEMSAEWEAVRSLYPEGGDFSGCVLTESVLIRIPLEYLSN